MDIIRLRYGNTNTYLISGACASVLVDTDYTGTMPAFYRAIKDAGVRICDIDYVLATHFHPDHCGLMGELAGQGVKPVVMETQMPFVHFSDAIFMRSPALSYVPLDDALIRELTFEESRAFLKECGIGGQIVSTPSHSEDSVSLILDDGTAIVGDLEPIAYLEGYDDDDLHKAALKSDWDKILSFDPRVVLHAHANEKRLGPDPG